MYYHRGVRRNRVREIYESLLISLASAAAIFLFILLIGIVLPG
tara:strand:- start:381 stop:509 length:129 start_codon:yes stop_codon:yes gene_type:complete